MDPWLFGKRLTEFLVFFILLLVVVFIILKFTNSSATECIQDRECVVFEQECTCGNRIVVNKNAITSLDLQKKMKCLLPHEVYACKYPPSEVLCENRVCIIKELSVPDSKQNDTQANE